MTGGGFLSPSGPGRPGPMPWRQRLGFALFVGGCLAICAAILYPVVTAS